MREAADGTLIVDYAYRYLFLPKTANNSETLVIAPENNGAHRG
jgi:hypothetical protein